MKCPSCRSEKISVVDSRDSEDAIRRRRLCLDCQTRFTTYERTENPSLLVIKKDGRRERFSREKLTRGMQAACKNRPVDVAQIEAIAEQIDKDIHILGDEEISSHHIGEKVLEALKNLDEVSYLRFASVHKSFSDLKAFEREIQKIKSN